MIAGGYLVAASLCWITLRPTPSALFNNETSLTVWSLLLALGVLLPSLFIALAKSVEQTGIVLTDTAQRLSLLLPLLAAFLFFGESFTWLKGLGLGLGLIAMLLIVLRTHNRSTSDTQWYWLLIVFLGMGCIDILFKKMAQLSQLAFVDVLFTAFVLAFVLFSAYLTLVHLQNKITWHWRNLLGALALGSFNFGNILFYIKSHQHLTNDPALVFASMNIGVIILGTLVGVWIFKETLSRSSKAGLGLAITAVVILSLARS